jgi:ABC-2 type transport system permease protein
MSLLKGSLLDFLRGIGGQVRLLVATPRYVVILFLLLGGAWLTADVYRERVVRDAPVVVIDEDGSHLSRTIRLFLGTCRELRVIDGSAGGDREDLTSGRVAAIVRIPADLSTRIKRGRPADVLLTVDGSNILVARNVMKAVAKAVGTVSAGAELTVLGRLGVTGDRAMATAVPIALVEDTTWNPSTNYTIYLVPGLLFCLLHVYVLTIVSSVFLAGGPRGASRRAGALVVCLAAGFAIGLLFLYAYLPRLGLASSSPAGVALPLLLAFLGTDTLLALAISAVVPRPLTALQITIIIAMLSLMLSGITWPLDRFPPLLAAAGRAIPFTPFISAAQAFLHRPTALAELDGHLAALGRQAAAFGGIAALAASVRLAIGLAARRRAA